MRKGPSHVSKKEEREGGRLGMGREREEIGGVKGNVEIRKK